MLLCCIASCNTQIVCSDCLCSAGLPVYRVDVTETRTAMVYREYIGFHLPSLLQGNEQTTNSGGR